MPSLAETLEHTPAVPRFGTSGIRGLVTDLDDLTVYCVALGTVRHLESAGLLGAAGRSVPIPIAGDLRASTERMLRAVARAIDDAGHRWEYAGRIPTPAVALHALATGSACFVVTGSHIPLDRNGIKAYRRDGELLKSDEAPIVEAIAAARAACLDADADASPFGTHGSFRAGEAPALPAPDDAAARAYVERYVRAFGDAALDGLRVLVFEHSAVGRDLLCEILERVGARVTRAGRSEAFVPIDTEALSGAQLESLAGLGRDHGPVDVVVSTDGDGDRPLIVDVAGAAGGRFVRGDLLGALVARHLGADAAAVPVTASPALAEWAAASGVALTTTRVGSPHVIEAMSAARAEGYARVVGWEANGGFLTGSDLSLGNATLRALPTRDAALPIVAALREAVACGCGVADLAGALPDWHGASGLLDEVPPTVSAAIVALGVDDEARAIDALEAALAPSFGPVSIEAVDRTDGLRLSLSSGEVAHVRPSGNAPQLRIYVFARSAARAAALVEEAVAEPGGLLRRLERAATG